MSRRAALILLAAPIVLFVAIQFIPVWLAQTNPSVLAEPRWDSQQTRALAQRACFDCHSNETDWKLYTRIAPISWLVTRDVLDGRRHLNFSEWGVNRRREREEDVGETIANGSMPPPIYLILHPEAQLSSVEKQQLIQGLRNSLR